MKVKELIKLLKKEDQEREVIMSIDPEGNGYSPLSYFWTGAYVSEWGEAYMEEITKEDREKGYTEEDLCPLNAEGRVKAIILSPVN